jgi:hypothetical protein
MSAHKLNQELTDLANHYSGVEVALPFQNGIKTDTIAENTAGNGVVVDGVTLKDGGVTTTGAAAIAGALTNLANVIDAGATTALTVAQSGSLVLLNSSDVVSLPAAAGASGVIYHFLAQTVATQGPRIDPNASEVLNLQGSDLTGGNYAEAAAIGDTLSIYCDGTKWWTIHGTGTWTYEGA